MTANRDLVLGTDHAERVGDVVTLATEDSRTLLAAVDEDLAGLQARLEGSLAEQLRLRSIEWRSSALRFVRALEALGACIDYYDLEDVAPCVEHAARPFDRDPLARALPIDRLHALVVSLKKNGDVGSARFGAGDAIDAAITAFVTAWRRHSEQRLIDLVDAVRRDDDSPAPAGAGGLTSVAADKHPRSMTDLLNRTAELADDVMSVTDDVQLARVVDALGRIAQSHRDAAQALERYGIECQGIQRAIAHASAARSGADASNTRVLQGELDELAERRVQLESECLDAITGALPVDRDEDAGGRVDEESTRWFGDAVVDLFEAVNRLLILRGRPQASQHGSDVVFHAHRAERAAHGVVSSLAVAVMAGATGNGSLIAGISRSADGSLWSTASRAQPIAPGALDQAKRAVAAMRNGGMATVGTEIRDPAVIDLSTIMHRRATDGSAVAAARRLAGQMHRTVWGPRDVSDGG